MDKPTLLFLRPSAPPAFLVLLLLLLSSVPSDSRYRPIDIEIQFNLRTQPIEALLSQLRQHLIDNMPRYETSGGRPYLAPKDAYPAKNGNPASPPGRWLKVHLVGETDNDRTTLAFGDSDIYLLAFANRSGDWNCFSGFEALFPHCTVLPSALPFKYGTSYSDLVGRRELLKDVPLGRQAALAAVRVLSRYNIATSDPAQVKRALATFMVIVSEGLRFYPIRNVYIQDSWEGTTFIRKDQTELLVKWGEISFAVYTYDNNPQNGWHGNEFKGPRQVGIDTPQKAFATVDLLKRPIEVSINRTLP